MDNPQNERLEEWFIIIGDWFRDTPARWFYGFIFLLVAAFPGYYVAELVFEQVLVSAVTPIKINYTEVVKQPLEVVTSQIFPLNNNTYYGYVRIKNSNADWGVAAQKYTAVFKNNNQTVMSFNGQAFILPSQEKILVFPRFQAETQPTQLEVTLAESEFMRPLAVPTLNLELQRRNISTAPGQLMVNAVIVNHTPFTLTQVDLPVLLYNAAGQVVGANYTNLNDLVSAESRSFQYVWYGTISGAVRAEIIPDINIYNREIFQETASQDPFDTRD